MSAAKLGTFSDPLLDRQIKELVDSINRPVVRDPGQGVIVTTPDGLNHYRIRVDNSGNVTTDLVTI